MVVVPQTMEKEAFAEASGRPKVAVVILNWNGRYHLEKFLPSVFNSRYPELRVIIGDNGSDDDSVAFVHENYPAIEVIQNDRNYGFAEGYNRILSQVEADYFVLLNSDVEVDPDWVDPVIDLLESQPDMAAAQPKIRAYLNRDEFEHAGAAGGFIDAYGYPFCRGRVMHKVEKDQGQYDDVIDIFWATGAALFIKRRCWLEAGGFDGDFFAHMEEIDLCWRLKRMGYRIGYCPESLVYHVGGATLNKSNPQKTYLNFRNNLLMLQKNLPLGRAIWVIFLRFWLDFAALLSFVAQGKFKDAAAVSRAHRSFFAAFSKTAKKRDQPRLLSDKRGWYSGSIVWGFYLRGKKKFSEIL